MRQIFWALATGVTLLFLIALANWLNRPESKMAAVRAPRMAFDAVSRTPPAAAKAKSPAKASVKIPVQVPARTYDRVTDEKDGIIINEINYHPRSKDRRDEWLE